MYIDQDLYDTILEVLKQKNMTEEAILLEMGSNRSKSIDRISQLSFKLMYHVVLVTAFEPTRTVNHWKSEIKGFLKTIEFDCKVKGGTRLGVDVIYETLWEDSFTDGFDDYEWWISKVMDKYTYLVPLKSKQQNFNKMHQFYTDVCGLLSMKNQMEEITKLVIEL